VFRANLIDTLVMPETTRHHLQSLCRKFTSKTTWSADYIEGKGEGSIVLLHGPPGVGKTYTAGKSDPGPIHKDRQAKTIQNASPKK
jgi:flagellar biosynthesis GTPase FlhF